MSKFLSKVIGNKDTSRVGAFRQNTKRPSDSGRQVYKTQTTENSSQKGHDQEITSIHQFVRIKTVSDPESKNKWKRDRDIAKKGKRISGRSRIGNLPIRAISLLSTKHIGKMDLIEMLKPLKNSKESSKLARLTKKYNTSRKNLEKCSGFQSQRRVTIDLKLRQPVCYYAKKFTPNSIKLNSKCDISPNSKVHLQCDNKPKVCSRISDVTNLLTERVSGSSSNSLNYGEFLRPKKMKTIQVRRANQFLTKHSLPEKGRPSILKGFRERSGRVKFGSSNIFFDHSKSIAEESHEDEKENSHSSYGDSSIGRQLKKVKITEKSK